MFAVILSFFCRYCFGFIFCLNIIFGDYFVLEHYYFSDIGHVVRRFVWNVSLLTTFVSDIVLDFIYRWNLRMHVCFDK